MTEPTQPPEDKPQVLTLPLPSITMRKKLLVTMATAALVMCNQRFKLGMSQETVTQVVALACAYLVGQGIADFGKGQIQEQKK